VHRSVYTPGGLRLSLSCGIIFWPAPAEQSRIVYCFVLLLLEPQKTIGNIFWTKKGEGFLEPNELAHAIVNAAADKKASDITMLDLRPVTLIADYFVLCDGQSARQVRAIADAIAQSLKELGEPPLQVEGTPESGWMLLDFGAVIAHVFSPELRAYYDLESLWKEAPMVVRMR
jgi:ribosome-associated protein